jgi:hypothetical protein
MIQTFLKNLQIQLRSILTSQAALACPTSNLQQTLIAKFSWHSRLQYLFTFLVSVFLVAFKRSSKFVGCCCWKIHKFTSLAPSPWGTLINSSRFFLALSCIPSAHCELAPSSAVSSSSLSYLGLALSTGNHLAGQAATSQEMIFT